MKKLQSLLIFAVLAAFVFTSCSKNNDTVSTPTKLADLKASSTFNWSTGKTVDVTITGLPTVEKVNSTLTIGLADGTVLFSRMHSMDENLTVSVIVPTTQTALTLKYGANTYTVAIVNGHASFTFVPTAQ